jgi:hypothetical protein
MIISEKTRLFILVIGIAIIIIAYVFLAGWINIGQKPAINVQPTSVNISHKVPANQQAAATTHPRLTPTPKNKDIATPTTGPGLSDDQYYDVSLDVQCTASHTSDNGEYTRGTLYGTIPLEVMINPDIPSGGASIVDEDTVIITNYKAEAYKPCSDINDDGDLEDCSCKWTYDGPVSTNILMRSGPTGELNNWLMTLKFLDDEVDRSLAIQLLDGCTTDMPDGSEFAPLRGPMTACNNGDNPVIFAFTSGSVIQGSDTIGKGADTYQRDFKYTVNIKLQ